MAFKLSPNVLAIFLMIMSVGAASGLDSVVKFVANEGMHPIQIVFFRNLFGLVVLLPLFLKSGFYQLRTSRLSFHILRGGIHSTSMISWFIAITLIPLADATALSFLTPIYASVGAILIMGEPSRQPRWIAIAIGFIGMLVILRPGLAEISLGSILVVSSGIAMATSKLMAKSLTRTDTPATIVFFMSLMVTFISFFPALFFWKWPPLELWFWLLMLGAGGSFAHIVQTHSYRIGEITVVEPMSYFRLIWATAFGFLLFGEVPEIWTWIGTVIIIMGALLLTREESQKKDQVPEIASIDHT